jgi:hypothetical protein
MLRNRATVREHQPKSCAGTNKKGAPVGDPMKSGDCVIASIATALQRPYEEIAVMLGGSVDGSADQITEPFAVKRMAWSPARSIQTCRRAKSRPLSLQRYLLSRMAKLSPSSRLAVFSFLELQCPIPSAFAKQLKTACDLKQSPPIPPTGKLSCGWQRSGYDSLKPLNI